LCGEVGFSHPNVTLLSSLIVQIHSPWPGRDHLRCPLSSSFALHPMKGITCQPRGVISIHLLQTSGRCTFRHGRGREIPTHPGVEPSHACVGQIQSHILARCFCSALSPPCNRRYCDAVRASVTIRRSSGICGLASLEKVLGPEHPTTMTAQIRWNCCDLELGMKI
jgi:hypothetical protein